MKNLKKSSNILYIVCTIIIVLILVGYLGNKNLKGTYSVYPSCDSLNVPSGKCGDSKIRTITESLTCTGYKYIKLKQNTKCSIISDTGMEYGYDWYILSKQGCTDGYMEKSDGTCVAKTQDSVTFRGVNGSKTLACSEIPSAVIAPQNTFGEKKYSSFIGWSSSTNCSSLYYPDNFISCDTSTLYACFKCTNNGKTVSIDGECSAPPSCSSITKGSCGNRSIVSTNSNYTSCTASDGKTYEYNRKENGKCIETEQGATNEYSYYTYTMKMENWVGCYIHDNKYEWWTDKTTAPNSSWELSNTPKANCTGCATGYSENFEGNCVINSGATKYTYKFYNKDGSNLLSTKTCTVNNSSTLCTDKIVPPSCSEWSGQKNCPTNAVKVGKNFFSNTDNLIGDSSWYCCDSSSNPDNPDNPNNPGSPDNPGGDTPNDPTTPSNVDENPKTGSVAIFLVWIIALGTLVYAGVYFKQARENN